MYGDKYQDWKMVNTCFLGHPKAKVYPLPQHFETTYGKEFSERAERNTMKAQKKRIKMKQKLLERLNKEREEMRAMEEERRNERKKKDNEWRKKGKIGRERRIKIKEEREEIPLPEPEKKESEMGEDPDEIVLSDDSEQEIPLPPSMDPELIAQKVREDHLFMHGTPS